MTQHLHSRSRKTLAPTHWTTCEIQHKCPLTRELLNKAWDRSVTFYSKYSEFCFNFRNTIGNVCIQVLYVCAFIHIYTYVNMCVHIYVHIVCNTPHSNTLSQVKTWIFTLNWTNTINIIQVIFTFRILEKGWHTAIWWSTIEKRKWINYGYTVNMDDWET